MFSFHQHALKNVKTLNTESKSFHALLTSFDGLAIIQPSEGGKTKFAKDPKSLDGLHHDQGPRRIGFHAIQGAVCLEEALEDDWCFKVITGSQ